MLLNSLIFLLLSNAIKSRRDKSILYSRVAISILLLSALITYDNLSLLFLAKGIGIFGGLFHTTATTNAFHIFIFLITSVILLLTSFYPRKVWLKHNSSPIYIKILEGVLISFTVVFTPLLLGWNGFSFLILILLSLMGLCYLSLIYNSFNKECYYNGDMLAVFTGCYLSLVENAIAHSPFNHTFSAIIIIIGLSMIVLNLLNSKKSMSIKDKLIFIRKNKEKLFIFGLAMILLIFIVKIILLLLGLGIIIDTSSPTLFLYTLFLNIISIKLVLTFIFCSINKEFKVDSISLNIFSVFFMFLLGGVNYFYIIPFVKVNLNNAGKHICLFFESSSIKWDNVSFKEGAKHIVTTLPIFGRYVGSLIDILSRDSPYNRISPFKLVNKNVIKLETFITPLTSISKFTTISMPRIIHNNREVSYLYKGSISDLDILLRNNSLYFTGLISNFVSNYSNLTCKINLTCADQIVSINTTFKNGHLEEFYLNRTNLNFANKIDKKTISNIYFLNSKWNREYSKDLSDICPKYMDSFYDPSEDRARELFCLTDPSKNGYNLQVFMQKGFNNTNYNIQESEASTSTRKVSTLSEIEELLPPNFLVETIYELPRLYNFSSITSTSHIQLGTVYVLFNNSFHHVMVDWNDFMGFKLRLLFQDRIYRELWPIIIRCNGITRFALAGFPSRPIHAASANWVLNVAQTAYAGGRPFFSCYMGGFIPPVVTTWYRLKEMFNLTVGTGFDDITYLEPDNYVTIPPNNLLIYGTSVFFRNPSTLVRIL